MVPETWPIDALEDVANCPYCGGANRTLAYEGVEDWAFGCAPGHWRYWDCGNCRALYLHPRPTIQTIGNAYSSYYTHGDEKAGGLLVRMKQRIRNEFWSLSLRASLHPRLGLPSWFRRPIQWLKPFIAEPFGLREMAQLPKGLLVDVGCGNGDKLRLANQLGWQAQGIEMDAAAVQAAKMQGLHVEQGGYELLERYRGQVDCVVCSHVLEHVHQPMNLLRMLLASLKPQGVLLLSAPNASSGLRVHYGGNWRGLEAPRHLAIPDAVWLTEWLRAEGLCCTQVSSQPLETAIESERIHSRALQISLDDVRTAKAFLKGAPALSASQQDIVQLVCVRSQS